LQRTQKPYLDASASPILTSCNTLRFMTQPREATMWTSEAPTEAGVYMWRPSYNKPWRHVTIDVAGLIPDAGHIEARRYGGEWWSEPIQEPSKPKEPK
jgi:hypothetical protein